MERRTSGGSDIGSDLIVSSGCNLRDFKLLQGFLMQKRKTRCKHLGSTCDVTGYWCTCLIISFLQLLGHPLQSTGLSSCHRDPPCVFHLTRRNVVVVSRVHTMTANVLAIASGNHAHVWKPTSHGCSTSRCSPETVDIAHPGRCKSVAWTTNGKAFVTSGTSGRVPLHTRDGQSVVSLPSPGDEASSMGEVACLGFSRGSKLLAAGCKDGCVHVWNVQHQVRTAKTL